MLIMGEVKILTSFNGSNLLNSAIPKNIENKNGHSYSNNNEENILNFNLKQNQINTNIIQDINLKYFGPKILKKEKIFKIGKRNKNIGRIKKNTNFIGKHNKFCEDNIIRKMKGRFLEKLRIYINNEYKKFFLNNKPENKK